MNDGILDIVPLLIILGVIQITEISPYIELLALIVVIGYTITRWYYLIKNKGKSKLDKSD